MGWGIKGWVGIGSCNINISEQSTFQSLKATLIMGLIKLVRSTYIQVQL